MNFIDYIKHIVKLRGYDFAYGDMYEINRKLNDIDFEKSKDGIVSFAYIITESEGGDRQRATVGIYFCKLCPFDLDANDTLEWQRTLRNAANTMFSDIAAGNISRTSNHRFNYGYNDFAENVLWVCARFDIESLTCGCNEFVFRDEIVKRIEFVEELENGDYRYKIVFNDGSFQFFESPRGPQGDDGPPGTTDFNELQNKPTKLSDFENDEGFITPAYHDVTKQDTITDLATIRSGADAGATAVQPSAISDMETRTHAVETYVAKESGKGLSSNDYTTAEKNKLAGIEAGAQKNVHSDWNENDNTSDAYIENKPTISPKEALFQDMWNAIPVPHAYYDNQGYHLWGELFSYDEAVNIYTFGSIHYGSNANVFFGLTSFIETYSVLPFFGWPNVNPSFNRTFNNNILIKVAPIGIGDSNTFGCPDYSYCCENCRNLVRVVSDAKTSTMGYYDYVNVYKATNFDHTFTNCTSLITCNLKRLKANVSFAQSSLLSNSSILYMVSNAQTTDTFTVTLHADAYARAMADTDIQAALATKTNVSLASA